MLYIVYTENAHKTVTGTKSIYIIPTYTKQLYNIHIESHFRLYISLWFKRKLGELQNIPKNTYWMSAVLLIIIRPLQRSYKNIRIFLQCKNAKADVGSEAWRNCEGPNFKSILLCFSTFCSWIFYLNEMKTMQHSLNSLIRAIF